MKMQSKSLVVSLLLLLPTLVFTGQTAAASNQSDTVLRFAVLGDAEPKPEPKFPNLADAVRDVNLLAEKGRMDFVVGVGDIAHKGTLIQYENATPVLQGLNKPFYPIMGNEEHGSTEARFLQFANLWNQNASNKSKAKIDQAKYVMEFDSLALIFASPDEGRDFKDSGIAWLHAQVKRLQSKPVMLIVHGAQQGVYPENAEKGISHPDFNAIVNEPNVAAVISGDLHMDMDRVQHSKKIGHVHYLHIPALERTKIPDESQHTPMYRVFTVSAAGDVSVNTYQTGNLEPLARHAYRFSLPNIVLPASAPSPSALRAPLPLPHKQQSTYLTVGDHGQIHWRMQSGQSIGHLDQAAELLDWRYPVDINTQGKTFSSLVAATVFLPEQQPGLVTINPDTGEITELLRVPTPAFAIENLCLSRSVGKHLSLYLLDERGTAEHWLVIDAAGKPAAKLLRRVPIAPNSKSCAVDDERDVLFIAEEGVGIWAQGASEESSPGRTAVDMQTPFGKLPGSVETLAVVPQGLIAAIAEEKQLALYSTHDATYSQKKLIDLLETDEPEVVKAVYLDDKKSISIIVNDEKTGSHEVEVPWQVTTQVTTQVSASTLSIPAIVSLTADVQTESMLRFGDAADDPAVWVNKKNPKKSRIIGTNKQQGLFVYDLQGKEVQHFNTGKLNNVDVRYDIAIGNKRMDIAVATNRDDNSLAIYTIDQRSGKLAFSGSVKTDLEEIYGFCLYQSPSHKTYAIPNGKSGEFQQIELTAAVAGKNTVQWSGNLVRRFFVKSQPEGCVADDKNQRLFVGEEDVAVWTIGAEPHTGSKVELVMKAGDVLVADIEGMGVYQGKQNHYLVVSSQGNNTFVVMDALPPFKVRGRVRIDLDADNNIDGVSETDGLEVSSANFGGGSFGGAFPEGMLVVQDGHKVMPEAPQNFKYIDWKKIRTALDLE